jgi:hypothetical protein
MEVIEDNKHNKLLRLLFLLQNHSPTNNKGKFARGHCYFLVFAETDHPILTLQSTITITLKKRVPLQFCVTFARTHRIA